jgi:hypothetical protein
VLTVDPVNGPVIRAPPVAGSGNAPAVPPSKTDGGAAPIQETQSSGPGNDGGNLVSNILSALGLAPTDTPPGTQNPPAVGGEQTTASVVNIGGQLVTPVATGAGVIVNGQTITGGAVTLSDGTPISIGPGGIVVVNGQTATVTNGGSNGSPITAGGFVATPVSGGAFIISGTTFLPGEVTTLPNGQVISVAPGGTQLVVNGQTATVNGGNGGSSGSPITVGGFVATPVTGGAFIISGTTFVPGEVTTLPNGQVISVAPGGTQLVVNGQTIQNPNNAPSAIPIIINGETITPFTSGTIIVGGQTLTPGAIVTLSDGHIISVGTSGTIEVDGTSTTLPTIVAATTTGKLKTAVSSNSASSKGSTSSNSSSSSTSTTSTTSTSRSVGGAVASGIGATKKADAAALHIGYQESTYKISFGFLLGLIGFIVGL